MSASRHDRLGRRPALATARRIVIETNLRGLTDNKYFEPEPECWSVRRRPDASARHRQRLTGSSRQTVRRQGSSWRRAEDEMIGRPSTLLKITEILPTPGHAV
jgi:hypothetical protein